jgi:hypothetical protein
MDNRNLFCPLFCLSFIDLRLLITPWYLLSIVLSVLHWFTPSYYPLVSFVHCFVCPSLIYVFLLPLGFFCPLLNQWRTDKTMHKRYQRLIRRRKSMKDRQNNGLKIPRGNKKTWINERQTKQWMSVLHWFTPSYYPLVSFVHYFVCPSLIYAFLLPVGIFCPLFCLSLIDVPF